MDHASLSKLSVAKLKEKCKELKITGYSKLSKPLLIERLLNAAPAAGEEDRSAALSSRTPESQANVPLAPKKAEFSQVTAPFNPPNGSERIQSAVVPGQQRVEDDPITKPAAPTKKRPGKNKDDKEPAKKKTKAKKALIASTNNVPPHVLSGNGVPRDTPAKLPEHGTANLPSTARADENSKDHARVTPLQLATSNSTSSSIPYRPKDLSRLRPSQNPVPITVHPGLPNSHRPLTSQTRREPAPQTQSQPPPTPTVPPRTSVRKPQAYNPKTFKPPAIIRPPRTNHPPKSPAPEPIHPEQSLDFSSPDLCTSFPLISMPPSTARRRQAERMSVVFSGIADDGVLGICAKVSRAWRYAVYLSATHTLYRDFSGIRLDSIRLQIKEPRMTNMWAYLRARRLEIISRYDAFQKSWLGRFFATEMPGHEPISRRVWTSPDDDRQITVALRFVSTRVVFSLARRYNECDSSWVNLVEKVTGAEEVIPSEIWKITTSSSTGQSKCFHILYDTGEVIGLAPSPSRHGIIGRRLGRTPHIEIINPKPGELRADWRGYILSADSGPNLQDLIVSGDSESYVAGVSAFWLRSLSLEGGEAIRRVVARRYVLSCVEPSSVSGEYRSVMDMAGGVAGVASHNGNRKSRHQVGLYISEHHLVESVHIPSSLHPALAVVTTAPGREYFVLRDTGTPIGTNDQGLELLWQKLIGCDAWGNRCAYTARAIG